MPDLTVRRNVYDSISNITEAICHFKGKSGLTVSANDILIKKMKEDSSFKEMIKDLKMSIKNEINRQKIFKKKAIFAEPELTRDLKCECLGNYTINLNYSFVPKYGSNCFDIHFYGYSTWNFDIIEKLFQDDEKEKNLSLNYYDGAPCCITYEFFHPIYIEYESISD